MGVVFLLNKILLDVNISVGFNINPPSFSFYIHWMIVLGLTVCYNLIYIPYSWVFDYHAHEGDVVGFEIVALLVYFTDIFVHAKTVFKRG